MILTIIALAGLVVLTPFLTRVAGRASGWPLAVAYLAVAGLFTPTAAEVMAGNTPEVTYPWIPSLGVDLALRADGIGVVFTYIALIIGAVVFVFSTEYLPHGRNTSFYWLMVIFTFSMVALVLSNDLLVLFVCWELTSLASFFLIARSGSPGQAPALRTMFFTFIGGLSLLVATGVIIAVTGTTNVNEAIGSPVWTGQPEVTSLVALLVAIAAMTKSAQFPFHPWLPDAMAAATPVSAYLHAAAVVKAGIFLMLRFSPAFHSTPAWNGLLIVAGLVTACLGGWFALNQHDVKKLMAYSTVSQLGLITAVIGVGTEAAIAAATLHVIAHALFKSGLFMMVGVVDHLAGTRDLARIPKLMRTAPAAFAVMIIGCASMAGIPPLLGFVSKEFLFTALGEAPGGDWTGWVALLVAAGASVLTFAYCAKTVWGSFIDGKEPEPGRLHHGSSVMLIAAAVPILASLPLSFVLFAFDNPLDQVVRAALPSATGSVHLELWHGVNVELIASAFIIGLGVLIILKRSRVFVFFHRATLPFDGADVIDALNAGLRRAGHGLSAFVRPMNSGPYLAMSFGGLSLLAIGAIPIVYAELPGLQEGLSRPVDVILLVLITVAVLVVCTSHSRLTTVVALSAVGILATVQILALGAPDVTLTQLLVEAMTIIVIMLVLQKLPRSFWRYPKRQQSPRLIFAIIVGASVTALTLVLNGRRERSDQRRRQHRQHDPRRIPCPRHPGRADRARYGRHRHRGRDVDGQGQVHRPAGGEYSRTAAPAVGVDPSEGHHGVPRRPRGMAERHPAAADDQGPRPAAGPVVPGDLLARTQLARRRIHRRSRRFGRHRTGLPVHGEGSCDRPAAGTAVPHRIRRRHRRGDRDHRTRLRRVVPQTHAHRIRRSALDDVDAVRPRRLSRGARADAAVVQHPRRLGLGRDPGR